MNLIKKDKLDIIVQNNYTHTFEIQESGIYLIEIIASAKNWWQNFKNLKSFFNDDDLAIKIDTIEFPKLNGKKGLFDGEVAWNGNNLKGLSKTNIFLINLEKGDHSLNFLSDQNPIIESIAIYKTDETEKEELNYIPENNNPAQDGNRRQWMTMILVNMFIKKLSIKASAKNYPEKKDDDDIKIIIDGNIQKNETAKSHKNWFWCGRILNGQEKEFNKELNFESGIHCIELWADGMPEIKNTGLNFAANASEKEKIKKYIYTGINNEYDYNRYDKIICDVVDYWNNEFLNDIYPVENPLDPSLVKAMIYQESKMGYYPRGEINIMQVGNSGDPSILTLNGELTEYWIHNGKEEKLDYNGEANSNTTYNSVYWGVRWLYHKAQGINRNGQRYWRSWKEAVELYGPPGEGYAKNVWSIYSNGIDGENPGKKIKLLSVALLAPLLVGSSIFLGGNKVVVSRENFIKQNIFKEEPNNYIKIKNIEVEFANIDESLFFTVSVWDKDWWEQIRMGKIKKGRVEWIKMKNPPSEQSILSARFLDLNGFENPIVEVYGQTHAGHGSYYFYEIKDGEANLLLNTQAVDINSDTRWAPDNMKKHGYGSCGEVFFEGRLKSDYEDLNGDGISDIILSGKEEIICDSHEINGEKYTEIKVAENPVKKVFLWNDNAKSFVSE